MCGIVGIYQRNPGPPISRELLRRMRDRLAYRGPDESGEFLKGPVALGHRRLSIIDLSTGSQPLTSADGRYTIVFNGEIYNYRDLRRRLEPRYAFRTASDTEVLLYHYIENGPGGLSQLNGMFAFAVWDAVTQELFVARDRFGKKPLYYHQDASDTFVFASELKSILEYAPQVPIDRQALVRYLLFEYIPADDTPFTTIKKLPAGSWMRIAADDIKQGYWWQLYPLPADYDGDFRDPAAALDGLLDQAVANRMVADVPVGVLLSGGIDSTTIAWYMRQHTPQLHSFSVGFEEESFNEAPYAALAARALGTQHHNVSFTLDSFHETLDTILLNLDEPLADASLLPTYLVSAEAKKHVTVVLDGDGADELFYGYDTFPAYQASLMYQRVPTAVRNVLEQFIYSLPTRHTYFSLDFRLKSFLRGMPYDDEIRNQVWIGSFHDQELHDLLTHNYQDQIGGIYDPITTLTKEMRGLEPLERLSLVYLSQYLQGDILQKIDRATMYASLEARTPFLDPRLVSFVLQLAQKEKYSFPQGKRLLRSVMSGRIPDPILKRKKQGFGIPLGTWLRGPLRDLMQTTLARGNLEALGMVNPDAVAILIKEHLDGKTDHRKKLWTLMVLHWWWLSYISRHSPRRSAG